MIPQNNIYVQGSYIDIHDNERVYLSVDGAKVSVDGVGASADAVADVASEAGGLKTAAAGGSETAVVDASEGAVFDASEGPEGLVSEAQKAKDPLPFTPEQARASGIRVQPLVVLNLMREFQPRCTQKVDWLSFYSVLLRRRWVDGNVRAWCRLVDELFAVSLDPRTLATDLVKLGSPDYTRWTDADRRIVRRKQLAHDFDHRLTTYFEQGRAEVMKELAG